MSYHIIDISTTGAELSVKDEQLVCKNPDGTEHKLPMEDIGAVMVNSFSATFHSSFLISAASHKVAVFLCDKFKPVSMVLPVQRATDTILTRAQIQSSMKMLQKMWSRTVDAKCANQYELASRIAPDEGKLLQDMRIAMRNPDTDKEGVCARMYWDMFSRALEIEGFRRLRDSGGLNGLLNYGYAVLMLRVEQLLLGCGLDPLYGMGHYPKERSMPLAYDMMEPFRPIVDEMVYNWVKNHKVSGSDEILAVDGEYKRYIQGVMKIEFADGADMSSLDAIVERVVRSYRMSLILGKESKYAPWIRRSSRWDG